MLTEAEVRELKERFAPVRLGNFATHQTGTVFALAETCQAETARANAAESALAEIPCLEYGFVHELSDPIDEGGVRATCGKCATCLARTTVAKRRKEPK